ncbi:hypothetical protein SNE40_001326 [Patella caerulea]|uniref:Neurotransmitter-gated ion-channel ligand-binding domain-containing protein n=1 Tax=Patella caerulea TaxID=87958 RepID=A0AAN8K6Y0_PATCE
MYVFKVLLLLLMSFRLSETARYSDQLKLVSYLFNNSRYDRRFRPVINLDSLTELSVHVDSGNSIEILEESQIMKTDVWLTMKWSDALLKWNSSNYGGLSQIRLKVSDVWYPDMAIKFAVGKSKLFSDDFNVIITYDGTVEIVIMTDLKVRCILDIMKFPFDEQSCVFYLSALNANRQELLITNSTVGVKDVGGGQWKILSIKSAKFLVSNIDMLNVTINVKRHPSFYIIYIVVPLIATAQINPVVFLIPPNSGEKVSTAVTILLSYSVYLNIISSVLPQTSDSISILSLYIASVLVLSGIYTFLCVLIVRLSTIENEKSTNIRKIPPSLIDLICFIIFTILITAFTISILMFICF